MSVRIISWMLLMSAAIARLSSSARIFSLSRGDVERSSAAGTSVLSARYMYTRMYECARYQPVLHVRITRNDRAGRFPLTLGAPAFLRRSPPSKRPPNYMGYRGRPEGRGFSPFGRQKLSGRSVRAAFVPNNHFARIYVAIIMFNALMYVYIHRPAIFIYL
jgi:hypothetical protein